ncbi:glycosyltransferase [Desulfosporosinus acidiphilus SJ4]|uniref:Glycosyltransferase n=1 Tax=Desulfosporosinus acidiphilus (strain DSM 22704 / JCM 16185 / SJ4) TaxID=646529 RepID=I4DBF7_DESAJ|nr:glycosyltransferase family 4 protein [Desulfosporosinus acidiphilus]AFM43131.1 glycosyltransferase [Desulfosporosinus acidiphilus SJ4]
MKIGFITTNNPIDKTSASGTIYTIFHLLKNKYNIEWIGPANISIIQFSLLIKKYFVIKVLKRKYMISHTHFFSRNLGRIYTKLIKEGDYDIIIAPFASSEIAYVETNVPIIYLSDATFQIMLNYYHSFENLIKSNIISGNDIESNALHKSKRIVLSSKWAADSSNAQYNVAGNKVRILKFGPNLEKIPTKEEIVWEKQLNTINLLFVGVDWERKGGGIALETLKTLNERGINTNLIIVGCNPHILDDKVNIIPFLNKNNNKDFEKLYKLFLESSFLILPTRAECSAIVYCEASAFALPILTTNTGGVGSYVEDNVNGFKFELKAKGLDYANKIQYLYNNPFIYSQLMYSTREKYERELNWDKWLEQFEKVIKEALNN